ncbi:phage terminase small subunit P27 family [Clostridium botulinum]|uniref:phage terminase small subunit P27 family n=1 Tax=Clostridium botulinum TaxID=1491 RepID=UPI0006992969|nr:phage terminase small subunit P27 family [Clostridium botulinum]KOA90863.1 terminase [Clostridium botulinum]MCD3203427.1 phage terminase small subunit P27 family [Clostridium botulinum C/D]MCD3222290.1 phage terminase small subunit P27 family [Clostridium botulinum C/D]MCD3231439.1 phage terminase small subunit P27 family [Clostridium botulinum C/D]MCD3273063.1 phage terminase small subunit P27 family [Clostridium botulinum C/D]
MARPCKSVNAMSKNLTKEEKEKRLEHENKIKGKADKIRAPSFLSKEQRKIFKYIVKELKESEILGNLDIYVLTQCAIAINRLQDIEKRINENVDLMFCKEVMSTKDKYTKDFFRCCNELSLSPQSRAKFANINLQVKRDKDDPVLKVLAGDDE